MGPPGSSQLPQCSSADALVIAAAAVKFEEMLKYPRALIIDEMVDYALSYLEWRDIGFRAYPLCSEAYNIRLLFTQLVGDVITRRALDIDGRLYSGNPWRQLANDSERFEALTDALYASRRAAGPPPDKRVLAACPVDEIKAVSQLADGVLSIAGLADPLDLPAYHQRILDWRADLMARLPQCDGAVQMGWLMNDISIDLAVLGSLTYVGVASETLPHSALIAENLARLSQLAAELGIDLELDATQ